MSPDPCLPRTTSHAARFSPQHPGGAPTTLSDKPILARPRRPPRGCSNASASPAALTSFEQVGRPLPQRFFARSALDLAPALLGLVLCHRGPGGLVGGRIGEVEAYCGPEDLAAHSGRGRRTPRNESMWGPAGRAYVYLIYGLHHCVNVVCGGSGQPHAVLIRALDPLFGLDGMRAARGRDLPTAGLCRGPGNLCNALGIDRRFDGSDLRRGELRLMQPSDPFAAPAHRVACAPRIGVDSAGEWSLRPWRFYVADHGAVSRPPPRSRPRAKT